MYCHRSLVQSQGLLVLVSPGSGVMLAARLAKYILYGDEVRPVCPLLKGYPKQLSKHMGTFCSAAAASAAAAFADLVQASTNTGVLFLDTFMKDCHVVNIALPSHAHLSLDIFPWSSLCFR